jgi:hypothetical protein
MIMHRNGQLPPKLFTIMKTSPAAEPSPAAKPGSLARRRAVPLQAEYAWGSPPGISWLHVIL